MKTYAHEIEKVTVRNRDLQECESAKKNEQTFRPRMTSVRLDAKTVLYTTLRPDERAQEYRKAAAYTAAER